jgi:CBS-domain-containing membrane protein
MTEKRVADIMERDVVTASPDDDVQSLIRLLREHELPGVPVTEDDGRLVGVVTESDLVLREEDKELHLPHYLELFGGVVFIEPLQHLEERLRKAFATKVRDMMSADVRTVSPEASVRKAAHLISTSGHNRLPVIENGRLVGVVTRVDCLAALSDGG